MGKIVHGNKNFGYAPITINGNTYSFGTPVMLEGLVGATIEVEQEDTNVYADDVKYCIIKGNKVRTANVQLRYIPSSYAQFMGYKLNANGSLTDTGAYPNHCIFFETEEEDCETGTNTRTLHYLYNVKASTPTIETATDEDTIEASTIEVAYGVNDSQFVVDDDGTLVQYCEITRTSANANVYDTFTSAVLLPTSVLSI